MRTKIVLSLALTLAVTCAAENVNSNKLMLRAEAAKYKSISSEFACAVGWAESELRHYLDNGEVKISGKKAIGLLQVTLYHELPGMDLRIPTDNIKCGLKFLDQRIRARKGNQFLALLDYNWGPSATDQWLEDRRKFPTETIIFIKRVTHYLSLH